MPTGSLPGAPTMGSSDVAAGIAGGKLLCYPNPRSTAIGEVSFAIVQSVGERTSINS